MIGIIKKDLGDKYQIQLTSRQQCVILTPSDFAIKEKTEGGEIVNDSTTFGSRTPKNDWIQTPSHNIAPMTPGASSMAGTPFRDPVWLQTDMNLNNSIAASSPYRSSMYNYDQ